MGNTTKSRRIAFIKIEFGEGANLSALTITPHCVSVKQARTQKWGSEQGRIPVLSLKREITDENEQILSLNPRSFSPIRHIPAKLVKRAPFSSMSRVASSLLHRRHGNEVQSVLQSARTSCEERRR